MHPSPIDPASVSYTHLDVYKRQTYHYATKNIIVFEFLFQNAIIFFFFAKGIAFWYILVAIYLLNQ